MFRLTVFCSERKTKCKIKGARQKVMFNGNVAFKGDVRDEKRKQKIF